MDELSAGQTEEQFIMRIRQSFYDYADLGLPIIPLCPHDHRRMNLAHRNVCKSPGKVPIIENWSKHTETTEDIIESWLKKTPNCNIGLLLGDPSGLVGVDVDGDHGEALLEIMSNGDLPTTWSFATGNGRRLLYRLPPGVTTKKFKDNDKTQKHEELALLVTGQQTVLPPSIHHTGRVYEWLPGQSPSECELVDAPRWLLQKVMIGRDEVAATTAPAMPPVPKVPLNHLANHPDLPWGTGSLDDLFPEGIPSVEEIEEGNVVTGKEVGEDLTVKVSEDDWSMDVEEGGRNSHITKLAGSLLNRKLIPKEEVIIFLCAWNQQHCKPPLPENEIIRMVENIAANEAMKKAKKGVNPEKNPFRPTPFVQIFLKRQRELGFKWKYAADQGCFYRCDETTGPWMRLENIFVQKSIGEILLDPACGGDPRWDTTHYINEAVNAMARILATATEESLFDLGINAQSLMDIISVQNGILHWRTGELTPWDPKILTTIQLPVGWDPEATCPIWENALREWIPDEQTRQFLQEFVGVCLIPDTSFRTAVFLYGGGANGKSIFIDAVRMLFGESLVSIPLHRLAERFEVANLQNKLINVCGDIDSRYLSETGVLKSIIGGDTLRGEFKHGKSFDFIPVCRLMFSANTLPKVGDKSLGWYSRWQLVEFPNTYTVDSAFKIELLRKLEGEREGILRWAIEGLQRVKQTNRFTVSKTMEESRQEYRTENDNVVAFLGEVVERSIHSGGETTISTAALHLLYRDWCENNGMKPTNQISFTKRIMSEGIAKGRRIVTGKSCAVFLGVKVTEAYQDDLRFYENARIIPRQ